MLDGVVVVSCATSLDGVVVVECATSVRWRGSGGVCICVYCFSVNMFINVRHVRVHVLPVVGFTTHTHSLGLVARAISSLVFHLHTRGS